MNGKKAKALRELNNPTSIGGDGRKACLERFSCSQLARVPAPGPKALKVRVRKPAKAHGATWPNTINQFKQTRPVIVMHPLRALRNALFATVIPGHDGVKRLTNDEIEILGFYANQPKHLLDLAALNN